MENRKIMFKEDRTYDGLVQIMRDSYSMLVLTDSISFDTEDTCETILEMKNYYKNFLIATQNIDGFQRRYNNIIRLNGTKEDYKRLVLSKDGPVRISDIILVNGNFDCTDINKLILNACTKPIDDLDEMKRITVTTNSRYSNLDYILNITIKDLWNDVKERGSAKDFIYSVKELRETYKNAEITDEIAHSMLGLSPDILKKMSKIELMFCLDTTHMCEQFLNSKNKEDIEFCFRKLSEALLHLRKLYLGVTYC